MEYVESLRVFRVVAETRRFALAADLLGITPSAVSRAVAGLEQRIGCRLFNRTTRQVSLTETAEKFYLGCCRILDDLDALESEASTEMPEPTGDLRLVAHTTGMLNRLAPLISSFNKRYGRVTVDITLTERAVDLTDDGFDVGILLPQMQINNTLVTKLLEKIPIVLVASPLYLAECSEPTHPADLGKHRFVPISPSLRTPEIIVGTGKGSFKVPLNFHVASNSLSLNTQLVLNGLGIGIIPTVLAEAEITSGNLIQILPGCELNDASLDLYLTYSGRTPMQSKIKAFATHVCEFFSRDSQMLSQNRRSREHEIPCEPMELTKVNLEGEGTLEAST
ncbi:DNA-binding transcriptional LysR family regulator [Paraburkholderia sp. GAS199]|uniref:LysR family transcriptional regulator n=1 Tax=Paraburkholderia sp. GAS199 TaxID=3035126 RepID=UPI003D19BEEE